MGQNTKCPAHGNEHPDFACPSLLRVKEILGRFYDGPEVVDWWLDYPNQCLDDRTPRSLINEGKVGVVLDTLEGALMGVTS